MEQSEIVSIGKPFVPSIKFLSPKKKSKKDKSNIENRSSQYNVKQNKSLNFQTINMPIVSQKPFQKIPKYNENEIIIKPNVHSQFNRLSASKSKQKKLTITKLILDTSKLIEKERKSKIN